MCSLAEYRSIAMLRRMMQKSEDEARRKDLLMEIDLLEVEMARNPTQDAAAKLRTSRSELYAINRRLDSYSGILTPRTFGLFSTVAQLFGAILSILTFLFGDAFIAYYFNLLIVTLPVWGTVILLFILGFVVYAIRSRMRLYYGIIEFFIGLYSSVSVFTPKRFDYTDLSVLEIIQILGGIYIMVRGLDNVSKALPRSIEPYWRFIFRDK
jgi:VIT1/CCC1 family predicted Fe2+/Mn2+ transporter